MKFQVTSSCVYNGGEHAEEGTVIDVSVTEAKALHSAGRGYPVKDAPPDKAEVDPPAPVKDAPPAKTKK